MKVKVRTPRNKRRDVLWWTQTILLTVGVILVGWFLYVNIESRVYQAYQTHQLDGMIEQRAEASSATLAELPGEEAGQVSAKPAVVERSGAERAAVPSGSPKPGAKSAKPKPLPAGNPNLIGRIEVGRLGLSAIVLQGVDDTTLRRAVGHVPGTAYPGEPGNVALSAHRDTFFRPLRNIKAADRITVQTPNGSYIYEVEATSVVKPTHVEVLDPTPHPALTLITCYPFNYVGAAPNRFIVRARQVEPAVAAPVANLD
jgi:sortase A